MNEEQSEKLINVLQEINENLKLNREERQSKYKKDLLKIRLKKFIENNNELKEYDTKYLNEILEEKTICSSYLFVKNQYIKKGGINENL